MVRFIFRLLFWIVCGILALIAGIAITSIILSWDKIREWSVSNKVADTDVANLKRFLENGKYRVISGVFSSSGNVIKEKTWTGTEMDTELSTMFGEQNEIQVNI